VRKATQERRAIICDLFRRGHSDEQIAKIMNLTVRTVHNTTQFMPQPGDEE
jgi:DNA-binding NarL/FixJ family response regulator